MVRLCTTKYRLPEPTRLAHLEVNKFRKDNLPELRDHDILQLNDNIERK